MFQRSQVIVFLNAGFLVSALASSPIGLAQELRRVYRQEIELAKDVASLLAAGKIDEAAEASPYDGLDPHGYGYGCYDFFVGLAEGSLPFLDVPVQLRREIYLRYYPFGTRPAPPRGDRWDHIAVAYVEALGPENVADGELARDSKRTLSAYQNLLDNTDDSQRATALFDEIMRHPQSVFIEAAAEAYAQAVFDDDCLRGFKRPAPETYREVLARMKTFAVPEDKQITVAWGFQFSVDDWNESHDEKAAAMITTADVLRASKNPFIRRAELIRAIETACKTQAADDQDRLHDLATKYAEEFPHARAFACRSLVRTCVGFNDPEAEYWADQCRGLNNKEVIVDVFGLLGRYFTGKRNWAASQRSYAVVVDADPKGLEGMLAQVTVAELYGDLGDDAKKVSSLRELAAPATNAASSDLIRIRSHGAIHSLALHYEAKSEWREAEIWWSRWQPQCFCGTCSEASDAVKTSRIAFCREKIKEETQDDD